MMIETRDVQAVQINQVRDRQGETVPLAQGLGIVRALLHGWETEGVPYCHWKSNEHLREALYGDTDLDVLVDRGEAERCEHVLIGLGYKRILSQPEASYPGIEDWLGFDDATGNTVHLHLHYQLLTGRKFVKEQRLPWERLILETAVRSPEFGVVVTRPSLELVLLTLRIALKTRYGVLLKGLRGGRVLPKNIRGELEFLQSRTTPDEVRSIAEKMLGLEAAEALSHLLYSGTLHDAKRLYRWKRLVHRTLRPHRRYSSLYTLARYYRYVWDQRARAVLRKLGFSIRIKRGKRLRNGGLLIALVGADGAGKSTLSKELKGWLGWKLDVEPVYLGSGASATRGLAPLWRRLGALYRRVKPPKTAKAISKKGTTKLRALQTSRVPKPLWKTLPNALFSAGLAKERHHRILTGKRSVSNGSVVLADRYPQTQFAGIYDGPKLQTETSPVIEPLRRLEARLFESMDALPPDLVIKLHVPLDVALQRKPESSAEGVARKIAITETLSFEGADVVDIDTTQPLEQVVLEMKRAVWRHL